MKPSIPFIKLQTDDKDELTDSILSEFKRTVCSSQFILGDKVGEFEKRFSEMVGTVHAVGVNSGLDALLLALRVAGVGPGDEVITVPNSFVGSAAAIALLGARPVFTDVGWDYNMDPAFIEQHISSKTRAILPVHLTGNPCRMNELNEIAAKYNLTVIEDAAQAVGARYGGKAAGNLAKIGCFSLHPLKNLHVWGDGGVVTLNDDNLNTQLRMQRNHGLKNRDEVEFFSFNSRLDTLQAIVALAYSELLPKVVERRTRNAHHYLRKLNSLRDRIKLPTTTVGGTHAWHVFQIWVPEREKLQKHLNSEGIETKIHYPIPIHQQPAAAYLGYRTGDFPITEELASGIVSLPVRENLTEDEVDLICDSLISFFDT